MSCNQCSFLPMLCQSQGINNFYNHCLSTFVNPWFILTNCWVVVPFDGFATTKHCDFLHPPVTWHLFPVAIRVQHSVFTAAQWASRTSWCKGSETPIAQVCAKYLTFVDWHRIQWLHWATGPLGHAGGTSSNFLPEVARNGVRSYVLLDWNPFNPFMTQR